MRNAGVINLTYDLPFGRSAVARDNPWFRRFAEDWQVSAIQTLLSGLPFTPQLSYNPSNDGDTRNPVRPSVNPNFTGSIIEGGPNQYFNPNAFIQPLPGTYGNVGRNTLQGPNLYETDFSVSRRFSLNERLGLQFRAEIFNLFNQVNFIRRTPWCTQPPLAILRRRRRNHVHSNQLAPGAIWIEAVVVSGESWL